MVVERVLTKEALKAVDLGWLLESETELSWEFPMASYLVLLKEFVKVDLHLISYLVLHSLMVLMRC